MTWLIIIFMLVGFLLMLYVLYTIYRNYRGKSTAPRSYPPSSFMRQVGVRCPDYWVYNDDKGVCVNQFNIPVNDPESCYDQNNEKKFKNITRWPVNSNELDEVLKGRCDWIRDCGPTKKLPASWLGVDDHC